MSAPRRAAAEAGGFVLVGAVMIVLALTILGLSLFSLSSFESQFMVRSVDQERAFHAAASAIERVKFNVTRSGRLERSWFGFPDAVVDSARAWQWVGGVMTESGPLAAGVVHIRVHARIGEAEQTMSGRYLLNTVANLSYRRLITTSGGVTVADANQYLNIEGLIYQRSSSTGWMNDVTWVQSWWRDSVEVGCSWIPTPNVQAMFDLHPQATLPAPTLIQTTQPQWHFDAQGQQPGYFRAPFGPVDTISQVPPFAFSFRYAGSDDPPLDSRFTLKVRGPAVWLLPHGFWGFNEVTVDTLGNGAGAALVIVAGPNSQPGDYGDLGIHFEGGIHNRGNVPIILVSGGRIELLGGATERHMNYLSMYAASITLNARDNVKFWLHHPLNPSQDQPGELIDDLASWGALPNVSSTVSSQLQLIAGSWKESKN